MTKDKTMQTKLLKIDPFDYNTDELKEAAAILKKGGIVAFPTETVYGFAADYNNKDAIKRLYEIKKRPLDKPFTIQISQKQKILDYIAGLDEITKRLIDRFWPGPLTIITLAKNGKKLGFRMPQHKIALDLINLSGLTIAAPSANVSGEPDPIEPFSVLKDFDGKIDMVIDAGPTKIKKASTVIDVTPESGPILLREGINAEEVKIMLKSNNRIKNILIVCAGNSCRSPIAEGLLKKEMARHGFSVQSAGIIAADGLPVSESSAKIMERFENIDMSDFRTQKFTRELALWADIILVMDSTQKDFIKRTLSDAAERTYLLKEFAGIEGDTDIADPMAKPFSAYEQSYREIKECVEKISEKLKKE